MISLLSIDFDNYNTPKPTKATCIYLNKRTMIYAYYHLDTKVLTRGVDRLAATASMCISYSKITIEDDSKNSIAPRKPMLKSLKK